MSQATIPLSGFKECDIRGAIGPEVTPELAYAFGRALASAAAEPKAVLGGDFRRSTPELLDAMRSGLLDSGIDVVDLGQLSSPGFHFARRHLNIHTGVMITASHSPAQWNGFKPVIGRTPITAADLEGLKARIVSSDYKTGSGKLQRLDIKPAYVRWLEGRFAGLAGKLGRVVFDCGSGATGWVIEDIVSALRLDAVLQFAEPDGSFPHRSPDISGPRDLMALQASVSKHDAMLGFGFDGDGDRIGMVDEHGARIPSDRLIAWLAKQLLAANTGRAVVYDLKLSKLVPETVREAGGMPVAQKSGYTFIRTSMLEHNALLGGEYSGHLFFHELDGSDDGLFAALLIGGLAAEAHQPMSSLIAALPVYHSTPEIRVHARGDKQALIEQAAAQAAQDGANLVRLDGVKAEYPKGWALMRASVTESAFTLRFEGDTAADMLAVARTFLNGVPVLRDEVWAQVEKYA
jgi:phosphomannomutase/phosphoglucomutase